MKKTKIVCTIGPASESEELLEKLVQEGMNVCRLNFSHGSYKEHHDRIECIKKVRERLGVNLAIALDTKGPEIRLGKFEEDKRISLAPSDHFTLTSRDILGNEKEVSISYKNLPKEVKIGSKILIDDGLVELKVLSIENDEDIHCVVLNFGELSNRKGLNLPTTDIQIPFLSEVDKADLIFGIEEEVDFIFASFVRRAQDVLAIRKILEDHGGGDIQILAKIESKLGLKNIREILEVADGIMVARGDLGVEIPTEQVPLAQKELIRQANYLGKPVIIATQMLDSMIRNPRATRAEVNDVANGILDGADAIMLSGETAAGKYPVEAVRQMRLICEITEESKDFQESVKLRKKWMESNASSAIAQAVCGISENLDLAAIVTATASGFTARQVSRYRPLVPIIAPTSSEKVYRLLSLIWGVYPVIAQVSVTTDELIERSIFSALKSKLVAQGDSIVLTAGIPVGEGTSTNLVKIHTIGEILSSGIGIVSGSVTGRACVGSSKEELEEIFQDGDILVCDFSSAEILYFMERSLAMVVEEGGLTSHAAIVGQHFGKPTIIGAVDALRKIKTGDIITVDASSGLVYAGRAKVL